MSRSATFPAGLVARAKILRAVAQGMTFTAAAQTAGRRDIEAVAHLVTRFNAEGLAALEPRPHGHPPVQYGAAEAERILTELRRAPDLEYDGTATWSLSTWQRALRSAPDGFLYVSTWTLFQVLHDAGYSWQQSRTWCKTGVVLRKRRGQIVEVTDTAAETKKG